MCLLAAACIQAGGLGSAILERVVTIVYKKLSGGFTFFNRPGTLDPYYTALTRVSVFVRMPDGGTINYQETIDKVRSSTLGNGYHYCPGL